MFRQLFFHPIGLLGGGKHKGNKYRSNVIKHLMQAAEIHKVEGNTRTFFLKAVFVQLFQVLFFGLFGGAGLGGFRRIHGCRACCSGGYSFR
ncbi:MAG: hypothetical protein SFW63_06990 [Alphaproteobacteria bacterium]|nr:hypothetical protein [Alphaproteobacteria bacterium]